MTEFRTQNHSLIDPMWGKDESAEELIVSVDSTITENVEELVENLNVPKKGRKRLLSPDNWKRNIQKQRRNAGKEYVSSSGKTVPARQFQVIECRHDPKIHPDLECQNCPYESRQLIFNQYWGLANIHSQREYLLRLIDTVPCKTCRVNSKLTRQNTRWYHLVINGDRKRVCKQMFLKTLDIDKSIIDSALKKLTDGGILETEKRGITSPPNKLSVEQRDEIITHIDSYPRVQSHYCRANSQKEYLPGTLNLRKLYLDYRQKSSHPVSEVSYRYILSRF